MTLPNPDHLFDQAAALALAPPAGSPRQTDLRRSISSAYYGLFHFTLAALADEFIGRRYRSEPRYALIYRSVDHRAFRAICVEVQKPSLAPRFLPFAPSGGFGSNVTAFASIAIDLQEKRHQADYDPAARFKISDAEFAVRATRTAARRFDRVRSDRRKTFSTLLLCAPR